MPNENPYAGIGLYFWMGYDTPNALVPGLQRIAQAGFNSVVRVVVAPSLRYRAGESFPTTHREYNFDAAWHAEVPVDQPFLPNAVRSSHFREAFSLPYKTFVLQAYDQVCYGPYHDDRNNRSFNFVSANAAQIKAEYQDMTFALYELHSGSGKEFIVSTWETDNDLFAKISDPNAPDGVRRPTRAELEERLRGLRRWFKLRRAGILAGRAEATASGYAGVSVSDGIEFNNFRLKQLDYNDPTLLDVLRGIIFVVKPDYATYSAWEISRQGDPMPQADHALDPPRFREDLVEVKNMLHAGTGGRTALILGELGVPARDNANGDSTPPRKAWLTWELLRTAQQVGVPLIILWKAFDAFRGSDVHRLSEGEGLIRADTYEDTEALRLLRANLANKVEIFGIVDQLKHGYDMPVGMRVFEAYGLFPGASLHHQGDEETWFSYEVHVSVEGQHRLGEITSEYAGHVNFSLAVPLSTAPNEWLRTRWFTFHLRRKTDGMRSEEWGPIPLQERFTWPGWYWY